MVEIIALGGYEEVGRNCTAVKYKDEIVIFDMGFHMERVVSMGEEGHVQIRDMSRKELYEMDAIPNDKPILPQKNKVVAIVANHGHLDHIGAMPSLAPQYNAPIVSTPFTIELIDDMFRDYKVKNKNKLITMRGGEEIELSDNLTLEFIHTTHSIPDTVFSVLHTPEGAIMYCNDFKLDNHPTVGQKPDYKRIREIGEEGIKAAIIESVRIEREQKTPSEAVARALLEDVILGRDHENALFVTTFASHIHRVMSILELAKKMNRQPVLLGRSMSKYSSIAERLGIMKYPKGLEVFGRGRGIDAKLKQCSNNMEDYLFICTGHQGEPNSVLDRLASKKFSYKVRPGDEIVFSSSVIPSPINEDNHYRLSTKMKTQGARLFHDVHVSGHASKEDHRDLLMMFKAENIVPAHGDLKKLATYAELTSELNTMKDELGVEYKLGQNVHLLHNGQSHEI
ncbi:RNase J family beta-CASP ribonuclease [Candidatus Undinarchaeota archaeon]